jgi:uncharacterized protein
MMTQQEIIQKLQLEPHIEGGYFRRTYTSPLHLQINHHSSSRPLLSSIYYLLTKESPIGHMHKNQSDIMHYYHLGGSLKFTLISPDGDLKEVIVGSHIDKNQQLQLLVPGGYWKASELKEGEFALISEAVSPGFDFEDMQLANHQVLKNQCPANYNQVKHLIFE